MPPHDASPDPTGLPQPLAVQAGAPTKGPLRPRAGLRRFLFLQGPISPFFLEVAQGLKALGHAVHRINLSLGDRLSWRGLPSENFSGRPDAWPAFIEAALDRHGITDIVLLGEQRDYHRAAIRAAQARGIFVTVTDFGYFRPDWITLEADGMGGDSRFPRDPAAISALAASLPPAALDEQFQDSFPRQAVWDVAYHLANLLPWPFPYYASHQLHHPLATYAGVVWRLLRRRAEYAEGAAAMAAIGTRPFWLFAMQMETDFSLRAYSPYNDLDTPIAETLASFARRAPPEGQLLFKVHPLDPCLKGWRRRIARMAEAVGLSGRVHVAHHGVLEEMLRQSQGAVTVNSTVGLRAVIFGRPLKAMGQAVWDVPGLAHQGALDDFWTGGTPPDPALRKDFLRALQGTTQLRGLFYGAEGRHVAVAGTVARLHADLIGVPDAAAPMHAGPGA